MRRISVSFVISVFLTGIIAPAASAQEASKTVLETKIVFPQGGTPKVSFLSKMKSVTDTETNEIQSALVYYAYTMNKVDEETRKALLVQVKALVPKVATEQGLIRANFLAGNPLLKNLPAEAAGITVITSDSPGQGVGFDIQPPQINSAQMAAGVVCLFQELVNKLSESGLRLLALSMGGMNKWYTEGGQASDPSSVAKAPAYALNLAVDIIEKVTGKKIK